MQVTRECRPYNVDRLGRDYKPGADPRFIKILSLSRFNVYLREANQDPDLAFRLYRWNMLLAETFLMPCHLLEVGLRNGLSRKMWARFGAEWPLTAKYRGLHLSATKLALIALFRLRLSDFISLTVITLNANGVELIATRLQSS